MLCIKLLWCSGTLLRTHGITVQIEDHLNVRLCYSLLSLLTASLAQRLRRPPLERKIRGSNPTCDSFFLGRVIPVTSKLALQWLPCQAPGVIGSALGLVSSVSVYCDWVRLKVWSATSISVWQHVKLSEQIRPWDTLACCWDVKQTTNKQTSLSLPL